MSSDSESDDEFSYTNTISKMNKIMKKLDEKLIDTPSHDMNQVTEGETISVPLDVPATEPTESGDDYYRKKYIPICEVVDIVDQSSNKGSLVLVSEEDNNGNVRNHKRKIEETIVLSDDQDNENGVFVTVDKVLDARKSRRKKKSPPKQRKKNLRQSRRLQHQNIENERVNPQVSSQVYVIGSPDHESYNSDINKQPISDEDFNIIIKVLWKSSDVFKFNMKTYENMQAMFQYFSKKMDIPEENLFFTINGEEISEMDTPESLHVNVTTIIEGGVLSNISHNYLQKTKQSGITLKIQIQNMKQPLLVTLKPEDDMKVLYSKVATELKKSPNTIKLHFDGDLVNPKQTLQDLELEGDECFDCYVDV